MESLPGKEFFRPDEVAVLVELSKRTIYRKLANGELSCRQKTENGPRWVSRDSIVEMLEKRRARYGL